MVSLRHLLQQTRPHLPCCGHADTLKETNHTMFSFHFTVYISKKRRVAIPWAQTLKTVHWTTEAENRSPSVLLSPHKQTSLFLKLHLAWWIPQWPSYCVKWYEPNKKSIFSREEESETWGQSQIKGSRSVGETELLSCYRDVIVWIFTRLSVYWPGLHFSHVFILGRLAKSPESGKEREMSKREKEVVEGTTDESKLLYWNTYLIQDLFYFVSFELFMFHNR